MGIDDQAGEGLGIEVGRFLGHDVALPGDGFDGDDGCRLEQERGVRARFRLDRRDGVVRRFGVADRALGDGFVVDTGESVEGGREQRDVERSYRFATGRKERLEGVPTRAEDRPSGARPEPESPAATRSVATLEGG